MHRRCCLLVTRMKWNCSSTLSWSPARRIRTRKKITRNCTQDSLAWVFLPSVHVVKFQFVSCVLLLVLHCLVCNCCCLAVCIVVVILCVIVVLCVHCCFFSYFRCRTAGQKSVLGRSCDRPPRHRFFLVSLCL